MIYLSGATNDRIEPHLIANGIGLMLNLGSGYKSRLSRYRDWAVDNGAFAGKWTRERWWEDLGTLPSASGCLFAVAPDIYGDARGSLDRGLEYAAEMRAFGWRPALVAQDGAEDLDWPWNDFDVLFLGGIRQEVEWKESLAAESLVHEARRQGLWVHMGRVNTLDRLLRADRMGCQSADGTKLAFGDKANLPELIRFLRVVRNRPPLPMWGGEGLTDPEAAP